MDTAQREKQGKMILGQLGDVSSRLTNLDNTTTELEARLIGMQQPTATGTGVDAKEPESFVASVECLLGAIRGRLSSI